MKVEFISYDGRYPSLCLCSTLKIKVDDVIYDIKDVSSGGTCGFHDRIDWESYVTEGEWVINSWPNEFPEEAKEQALDLFNSNVEWGCCGGCL